MVIGVLLDVLLFGCLEVVVAFDVSLSLKRPSLSDGDASRDAQPALQHKKKKKNTKFGLDLTALFMSTTTCESIGTWLI